ncbi:MAG: multidrug ABC transporter ATP-binding protein [Methanomicrobiales archaeon HGW-Methanomicrobiales-4]|nr:MAG: multidrug ABC transporter ATP-binding protein [Methanomicrobiales archaeon HGW-Methanomicrobiales-4]
MSDAATGPVKEKKVRKGTLGRLMKYLLLQKGKLLISLVLLTIGTFTFLSINLLLGDVINILVTTKDIRSLINIALIMGGLSVITLICLYIGFRFITDVTQNALFKLRQEIFEHMQTLSLRFFDKQPIGELMSRVTNDMDTINNLFQAPFGLTLQSAIMLVLTIMALFSLSPLLAGVAVVVIPILAVFVAVLAHVSSPSFTMLQIRLGDLNGVMEETLEGQRTVISNRHQRTSSEKEASISTEVSRAGERAHILALFITPLCLMASFISIAIVAVFGVKMLVAGTITIGALSSAISYCLLFVLPLFFIFFNYNFWLSAMVGAGRIFEILDSQPDVKDKPGAKELPPVTGHIVFKDVNFSYVPGRRVMKEANFEAKPGMRIGLCGPTGAGKSTIINILTRYYDIDSGEILVDGINIADILQDSLRKQIGVVLQEPILFTDTVMNNLKYAREGATNDECIAAAKAADCDEFVKRLPHGYDTVLIDGGANLSQGQRQLLTIARAMIAQPKMLILDEATSNVDTRTEKVIQGAIRKLQEGVTSFSIAHRLSTIKDSDKILVVDDGAIVEQGDHDHLMAMRGLYYNLYMSQYKGKIGEVLDDIIAINKESAGAV